MLCYRPIRKSNAVFIAISQRRFLLPTFLRGNLYALSQRIFARSCKPTSTRQEKSPPRQRGLLIRSLRAILTRRFSRANYDHPRFRDSFGFPGSCVGTHTLLIASLLYTLAPCQAQASKNLSTTIAVYYQAPWHWKKSQWKNFGLISFGVVTAYQFDRQLRERLHVAAGSPLVETQPLSGDLCRRALHGRATLRVRGT